MTAQQMLTMYLQQMGAEMPPQRIMELAVQLIEDTGVVRDFESYAIGVAEFMAMLVVTGEFGGKKHPAVPGQGGDVSGGKGGAVL